jgi:thiol-disulfide isomerase/thioredoxin
VRQRPLGKSLQTILLVLGALAMGSLHAQPNVEETTLEMDEGIDVPVSVFVAEGPVLVWLPSEHGLLPGHVFQAERLQAAGIEVWLPDPFAGYFLPTAPSSFDRIPTRLVPRLIEAGSRNGKRPVFVFGNDRAAPWLLEGLREWQIEHPGAEHLRGLLLMSPYLHTGLPEVGEMPEFHPIARATNLPVYLIQPVLSPQYPMLQEVRSLLETGGSAVALRILPEVRDRFFFRPNTLEAEEDLKSEFADELIRGMRLLARVPAARVPPALTAEQVRLATPTRQERLLEPLYTRPEAPPLRLPDLEGELHDLTDYRGDVVLINFWASWCPPCVREMPSMQQLEDQLRDQGFRILAVNLGESEATIRAFLERVGTDFTVLLDPQRASLEDWRALAYPSSYLVDRQGRLSHSLYGAIEWHEPGVVAQIQELLDE